MVITKHTKQRIKACFLFRQHALLVTLLSFLCIFTAYATEIKTPLPGHQRVLEVPRIEYFFHKGQEISPEEAITSTLLIDGKLDEKVWEQANVSSDFWCSLKDKPPSDQTEVLVMRDDKYLYFGFRLYDKKPEAIRSVTTVRDVGLGYDDAITVQLDSFFNRRNISSFSLNPRGAQSDSIAGGRSSKIEWKGDWLGAATRTESGWTAEFAIPFAILNYKEGETRFGVNFQRYQSRTKEYSYWADITLRGLNEEMGQLTGLELPSSSGRKAWTFMPFMLAGANIPDKKGKARDSLVTGGMDIRYQPRSDMTVMLAINPDFSQVEQAVTDISFSYSEKALSENRPFFAEGAGYFSEDNNYFYSRRVPDFDFGAKSFGRIGRSQFGLLATQSPYDRYDFAGRLLYEVDETNSAKATLVSTKQADFNNILSVVQFGGRQDSGLNYSIDAAFTNTSDVTGSDVPKGNGACYAGSLGWQWDYFYVTASGSKYDTRYFPADALLSSSLPGTQGASIITGYYRDMSHPLWHVVQGYVGTDYREETAAGRMQNRKVYASGSIEFNNDIRVGVYHDQGPYRQVSSTRGVFQDTVNQDQYSSATVDFNTRSNRYAGGLECDWGKLGGGEYEYYSAYGWWRPVNSLYLNIMAERADSFGISNQIITTASWNITPERTLATRYIYTDDVQYYRFAYAYRPRKGLDIFLVYDDSELSKSKYSIKIVKTF